MFASISKLFRKSRRTAAGEQSPFSPPQPTEEQAYAPSLDAGAPADASTGETSFIAASDDKLAVSYGAVLKAVPQNLHGKNASTASQSGKLFISRRAVLDQVGKGAVRIKFNELRSLTHPGLFTTSNAEDETLIDLPLAELVPQLNQNELTRHPRHRLEVPTDVADLFDCKGGGL